MKSIFITGAASGIGKETALLFASKGWYVGLYDLNRLGLERLSAQIGPDFCCYQTLDVTESGQVEQAIEQFSVQTGGTMDILFNCAGILSMGLFAKLDLTCQLKIVDVNLKGTMNCIYRAVPLLTNTKNSRIISMSSASAIYGTPELATYSATKFAIRGLTEALNLEFERHGIHVCDVMVPYVQTPLLDQDSQAGSIGKLGINISPVQVANLVWSAAHKYRLHWNLGIRQFSLLFGLFPFARKPVMKWAAQLSRD